MLAGKKEGVGGIVKGFGGDERGGSRRRGRRRRQPGRRESVNTVASIPSASTDRLETQLLPHRVLLRTSSRSKMEEEKEDDEGFNPQRALQ
jgi:hypothetical protein